MQTIVGGLLEHATHDLEADGAEVLVFLMHATPRVEAGSNRLVAVHVGTDMQIYRNIDT